MQLAPDNIVSGLTAEKADARGQWSLAYRKWGKPVFDMAMALMALPILLPIIAVLYVLTRRDGGSGFYGHTRIGRNGKPFTCWKIRTMVTDSADVLKRHLDENPDAAIEWARDFKLDDDPRVTRLGKLLRSSSLDELPQLWNVMCGEMSFVGPRPVTAAELPKYSGYEWSYMSVRPGITGLWQVSGRNDIAYDQRVQMDARYVDSMSFLGDASIIARTAMVVLKRNGK